MKPLFGFFLLIFMALFSHAQTPSVTVHYGYEPACLNNLHRIPVVVTGSFETGNQFSVQVREEGSTSILTTVPALLKDDHLEVVYRDSTLSFHPIIQFRVVSSAPRTESSWTSFGLHTKGTVKLSAAISDTVNLGEELVLKFTTLSTTEVDITLNDGTQLEISPYSRKEISYYHTINAHTAQPFYIRSATNSCGAMQISGEVRPVVNRTAVRTKSADVLNACENSEIRISVATNGPPLEPGPNYRVRFRSVLTGSVGEVQTMEAPAELKDGLIVTRIPDRLRLQEKQNFNLIVLADHQDIVGAPGNFVLSVYPKPSVTFYTPDVSIDIGNETRVGVVFKGVPPFSAELGDGSTITANYSGEVYLPKIPGQTTTYRIHTMSSGCGITNLPAPQNMTVRVNPGIALVPESYPAVLCAGTTARVRIRSSGNFSAATSYTVSAYYSNHHSKSFPATRNGDYLEFRIPELPGDTDPSGLYDQLYHLSVITQNPSLQSAPDYTYLIQSRPQVVPDDVEYTFNQPDLVTLRYRLYGKSPFTIEDQAGNKTELRGDWWMPQVYVDKTKDFRIKSVSNSCFKTENIPSTRLTLTNQEAPGLFLEPVPQRVCANDSLEVTIVAPGRFSTDNEFQIQAYDGNFKTLKAVRSAGTYKIKIPESPDNRPFYFATIRVISTHPFLTSETYQFYVETTLKDFQVSPSGNEAQPALLANTDDHTLYFSANGGLMESLVYSDGITDRNVIFENPDNSSIPVSPAPGQTTVYTLKSMTNSCGTQTTSLSTHVRVQPYVIRIADFDFTVNKFCAGNPIQVPVAILNGAAGNATFGIEISRADESHYRTISSGERSTIVKATLPADLTEGNYKIRVVSSDGVASNTASFYSGVLPSATISSNLPQPITVSSGSALELNLHFTGTSPWTAVFEDNTNLTSTHPASRWVYPKTGRRFEIKSVYNQCGYGEVSGSVEVKVNAYLAVSSDSYTACNGKTFTVDYELQGDADLSPDYIRFELIDIQTSKVTSLDSTKIRSGKIDLKLPSNLTASSYQLRCTLKKAGLSTEFGIRMSRPVEVTLSGNTVINSGDQTMLTVRTDNTVPEIIRFQLSDGTEGDFHGGNSNIAVRPSQTTTYTLTSVSNSCGAGTTVGSATVEVNPPAERTVSVNSFGPVGFGLCIGDSIRVHYSQTGSFTGSNTMTVQVSDATGRNFTSIPTIGKTSPLRALLPSDLQPGNPYRIRVAASDPGTANGAYPTPLITGEKAGARFESDLAVFKAGSDPLAVVLLSGSGPWQYELVLNDRRQPRYSSSAVDSVYLQHALPGQVYRLQNVYGQCGAGSLLSPGTIMVTSILGTPESADSRVLIAPNPAYDYLQIKFETTAARTLTMFDSRGVPIRAEHAHVKEARLDLHHLPSGVYLLSIEENGSRRVYRVVKY